MRKIYLIARREYLAYVAAWGFWLSLISAPLLIGLVAFAPLALSRAEPPRAIAVLASDAGDRAAAVAALTEARGGASGGARYVSVDSPTQNLEGLKPYLTGQKQISVNGAGQGLFAAISIQRAGQAVSIAYWSANLIDMEPRRRVGEAMAARMRVQALTAAGLTLEETNAISNLSPTISHFDPRQGAAAGQVGSKDRAPYLVATLMAVALWSAVIGVANMLLTGVVEEKSNKILDQLLTRASPLQILIGKLLGVAMVSATLFAVWGGLGFGVTHLVAGAAPQGSLSAFIGAAFSPDLLVTFALCFVAGYLMFGALFLGLGALCDSLQEAQSLLGPVVFLLIPPILLVGPAIDNPNSPVVAMASWAPLFAPFVLMMRAPSDLAPIEIVGPALVMAIFTLFVLVAAARLFRAGAVDQLSAAAFKRALWPFGGNSKAAINK